MCEGVRTKKEERLKKGNEIIQDLNNNNDTEIIKTIFIYNKHFFTRHTPKRMNFK